jgi:cell migration-inducing and hyaluronan-binding protein
MFTSFGMSSNNTVARSKFINAKPVYFPPITNKWSNDDYGNTVYKTAVFKDKDGTITGIPNSFIVNVTGIDADKDCVAKPTWNAVVCKGDVGRMNVGGGGGAIGFGGFGGGGGPPGGGGAPGAGGPGGGAARAAAPGGGPAGVAPPGPGAAGPAGGAARPPAQPVVYQIAPGGGRIRGTRPPSGPPVVLSRNGKEFTADGETNVRAGSEYKVTTERPSVNIMVKELDAGSWVMFELPGFSSANSGTAADSLDALRKATATSYYKGNGSLWVKIVSTGDILGSGPGRGPGAGDSLQVGR